MSLCPLCNSRKPKRHCPALSQDICPQCCAREREVSIQCPITCDYLRESRKHEPKDLDQATMPHRDVQIDEAFLQKADVVLILLSAFLNRALQPAIAATDADAREALETLIAQNRGAASPPANPAAAGIVERFQQQMDGFLANITNREGDSIFAPPIILGILVFLARVCHGHNNGKPYCRSFLQYLNDAFPQSTESPEPGILEA